MLYDANNPILQIIGVEHMRWKAGNFQVAPRDHGALAFRIRGSAKLVSDGKEWLVNTNDILYLPQNVGYTAHYTDTEMLVVHFVTARDDRDLEVYSLENCEQLYKMFLQMHTIWKNKKAGFEAYAMAQLYNILGAIQETQTNAILPEPFIQAMSFINTNYRDHDLCVDAICGKAGISATVFRQLFKRHYQKTPTEYVTGLRLEYARNLISGGSSVENAAFESGFNDPKYFARTVKKFLGCTPRDLKTYGK